MKMIFKPTLLFFFIIMSFMACNNDEIFVEPNTDVIVNPDTPVDTETPVEDAGSGTTNTTPCDFNFSTVQAGDTVIINCVLDLGGATVTLPANVTIVYEGGDIINGTLNFSDNSIISGELLNSSLTLGGSSPLLKDPTFEFIPSRWGIVEGEVPQDVASDNQKILQEIFYLILDMGVTTFSINELDAYFYGEDIFISDKIGWENKILSLPSNFTLEMTDKTHLRAYVNSKYRNLIYMANVENVKVTGGHLYGFRHLEGNDDSSHFNHVINITSGQNITIENVHASFANEDGLTINSARHAYQADYIPSKNVLVKGCTFNSNGRLGLSVTDGQDIIIEGNTLLNSGVDTPYSPGRAPRYGMDVEPLGYGDAQPLQKVDRVIIRNNYEENSAAGGLILMDGDDITVSGNTFKKGVYVSAASNVRIVDNPLLSTVVVGAQDIYGISRNENIIVSGNTIKDGSAGIQAYNKDLQIFDNDIIDCALGIQLNGLKDSRIYNNRIYSRGKEGDGINAINYVDNVIIENNSIDVDDKPFYFAGINGELDQQNYTFTFNNNTIKSGANGIFQHTYGGIFTNNTLSPYGFGLTGANNFIIEGNHMVSEFYDLIEINNNNSDNILIKNNILEVKNNYNPGNIIKADVTNSGEDKNIVISDNTFKIWHWLTAVKIEGFNGITVKDNKVVQVDADTERKEMSIIYYRGDNSNFINNKTVDVDLPYKIDVVGQNNTVQ
jgi:parallel beta-helix repeat protein